jgi:cobalt/nickel transport system ATP-binding protein
MILQARDLSIGHATPVAQGLTFTVNAGERVGLVGPNGAGKSSLLLTLAGVLVPLAGQVIVNGTPLRTGTFRPDLAMVFQQPEDQLFCPTLAEDVAFGPCNMGLPEPETTRRVDRALAQCALTHLAQRPVHHLSGGEKRRASIAGALAMQPDLMLLDEPSTALDMRNRRQLITLLQSLPQTMLVASHDLELLLDLCPRVMVLDDGRICADGHARVVLADTALMAAHGQEVPHSLR